MRKVLIFLSLSLFTLTLCAQSSDVAIGVNKSTIYKVEKAAIWTTSLNQLTVITKHCVTSTTLIYLNDKPSSLSQLKPGFKVVVYYILNDPCKTAVKIMAYSCFPITPLPN